MLNKNKKFAFTLAEIMVVMLVLTIIFAAFAPLITKRRTKPNNVDIWQWSSRDYFRGPMDAYYPSSAGNRGSLFFGLSPDTQDDVDKLYTPYAKVIIRSGPVTAKNIVQRQLQLRFRRSSLSDAGDFAGTLLMDTKNVLLGGYYDSLYFTNDSSFVIPSVEDQRYPNRNVAIGYMAFNSAEQANSVDKTAKNNTAVGFRALYLTSLAKDNVAVGAHSGEANVSGSNNVYLGSMAGYSSTGSNNVYVGYSSGGGTGNYNTFIGAHTGNIYGSADDNEISSDSTDYDNAGSSWGANNNASYNVAIGYRALNNIRNGRYNTAIGAHALENVANGNYNTAIGYGACRNVTDGSYKTCIGFNSGPTGQDDSTRGFDAYKTLSLKSDDGIAFDSDGSDSGKPSVQRTYIGSTPTMYALSNGLSFGGDAILEIHNSRYNNKNLLNEPDINSNTTTIVNGNLLVRGTTFFTIGNKLYPFYFKTIGANNYFGTELYNSSSITDSACTQSQRKYSYYTGNTSCSALSDVFCTTAGCLSDRRLKYILGKNNDGLNEIEKINVYNYTFKADKDNLPHVGVIAQELQKIFPKAVAKDHKGFLSIRREDMFYAAVNAIKELERKISALFDKLFNIEHKIEVLEAENEELSKEIDILAEKINSLKQKY